MTADRTEYWREYNRRNAAKKREQHAAFRERNREKIREANRAAWAAGKGKPRKKPSAVKPKARSIELLRQKFSAFRAKRAEGLK
jgi:hypothetical protein